MINNIENDDEFEDILKDFIEYIDKENIDIYNEDSFKFELGIYLRKKLPNDYHVDFERNIKEFLNGDKVKETKHEIDISIYKEKHEKIKGIYAIELKFPSYQNNTYNKGTNRLYEELKMDRSFVEKLVSENVFKRTWSFVLVNGICKSVYEWPERKYKTNNKNYYDFRDKMTWKVWKNGKYYLESSSNKSAIDEWLKYRKIMNKNNYKEIV